MNLVGTAHHKLFVFSFLDLEVLLHILLSLNQQVVNSLVVDLNIAQLQLELHFLSGLS